jgi:hypothetical protein
MNLMPFTTNTSSHHIWWKDFVGFDLKKVCFCVLSSLKEQRRLRQAAFLTNVANDGAGEASDDKGGKGGPGKQTTPKVSGISRNIYIDEVMNSKFSSLLLPMFD